MLGKLTFILLQWTLLPDVLSCSDVSGTALSACPHFPDSLLCHLSLGFLFSPCPLDVGVPQASILDVLLWPTVSWMTTFTVLLSVITCALITPDSSFPVQLSPLYSRPTYLCIKLNRSKLELSLPFPHLILLYYETGPTFPLDTKLKNLGMILDPFPIIFHLPWESLVCNYYRGGLSGIYPYPVQLLRRKIVIKLSL